ncbi:MAG: hypothetical protein B6D46_16170 [Polyangiaceae bacterium UTPRO1]|jgi:hypothetical protein|nr:hypothetical protein [Myxococcales bacterium]OQY64638.1 MAG: hypothetical protein B6D46_16170 [Polyangiaceae bacterium UTPRO1]
MANAPLLRFGITPWNDAFPLLPEQFTAAPRALEVAAPERRLLLAVLCDAIVVFQRRIVGMGAAPAPRCEAERWILANDRRWPFSYVNVCEALGIAPEPLRRALVAWRWRAAAASRSPAARRRLLAGKHPIKPTGSR